MSNVPAPPPAQLAKAALRRLAAERQEPTPENFRQAYEAECTALGVVAPTPATPAPSAPAAVPPPEDGPHWADLISRISRGQERSHKQWTAARKKESIQRVLDGSRQSGARLLQRLQQLVQSWDTEQPDTPASEIATASAPTDVLAPVSSPLSEFHAPDIRWIVDALSSTVNSALPDGDPPSEEARRALEHAVANALAFPTADASSTELNEICSQAKRIIEHRQNLVVQLVDLCQSLTDSLVDLAEDDSWVRGQCEAMRAELSDGLNSRGTRRMQQLLESTRQRQKELRQERDAARTAIKQLIQQMLGDIGELGNTTGRFQDNLVRYADTIGKADTLQSLTGVVREMVEESRATHQVISQAQERLHTEHARATELTERVRLLEDEIRKLSDEVSTDPLTQIANRRGMMRDFESESARVERQGTPLSVGLLDVDNFKKLNDSLGHQTGDVALKFLSRRVTECLRPHDVVARYGGEEFVVMLPDTQVEEGQQILTRLQRLLSAEFFTHDENKVFITFSAGITAFRLGETIEAALDRADLALYEAKRTGKNRTCMG